MARPLRIDLRGGWYHVTARGNERRAIFRDEKDRVHFVELLADWVERFGLRMHAYVLMDNHYHLLVETPRANLSPAMQWLQVSYTVWFNRRHRRAGHLFQGRFHAVVLEAETAALEVSRYLHLNPVRVRRLGLDKTGQSRAREGLNPKPGAQQIRERVERLRQHPWSSYGAYTGWKSTPTWLTAATVLAMHGRGALAAQQRAYRRCVEEALREVLAESPWERLEAGVVLGGRQFVERIRRGLTGDVREQPMARRLRVPTNWEAIVRAVERVKGERWDAFRDRYGDWGRDAALYLARRRGFPLRDLAVKAGGIDYASAASAVRRVALRQSRDRTLAAFLQRINDELHNK